MNRMKKHICSYFLLPFIRQKGPVTLFCVDLVNLFCNRLYNGTKIDKIKIVSEHVKYCLIQKIRGTINTRGEDKMNVNTIVDQVYQFLKNVNADTVNQVVNENMMIALIVTTVIGILLSMFGLKLLRLWGTILGFLIGAGAGFGVTEMLGLEQMIVVGATIGAGIILAFLSGFFYKFGIFLLAFLSGIYIAILLLNPQDWIFFIICIVIGLVIGLLALKFMEPIMIVVTSIIGGVIAGDAIATLAGLNNHILRYGIMIVIAVIGAIVQFTLESGKRKKKNLKKAAEIRKQNSTENDVEKARAMFEDSDEAEEQEEKETKKNKKKAQKEKKKAEKRANKKSKAETVDKMEDTILLDDEFDDEPEKEVDRSYLDDVDESDESAYVEGYNPDDYTDLDDLEDDEDFIIITDDDK